jgi:hypothetical protein
MTIKAEMFENHAITRDSVLLEGCDDSTPVRGASYEPAVLSGVSAEPRLSHDLFLFSWGAFFGRVEAIAVKATVALAPQKHNHNHDYN